jgi:hypothetical protein
MKNRRKPIVIVDIFERSICRKRVRAMIMTLFCISVRAYLNTDYTIEQIPTLGPIYRGQSSQFMKRCNSLKISRFS